MSRLIRLSIVLLSVTAALADSKSYKGKLYPVPDSLPAAKAFFPLTDGSGTELASWPGTDYTGTCNSTEEKQSWWVPDDLFGNVVYCTRNTSDYLVLPSVSYAATGNFTIAFWFKPDLGDLSGDLFEYLYSHSAYGLGSSADAFAANTISVYLPEQEHPAYGLVRTIVKDATDPETAAFLDTDGTYNNNLERRASFGHTVADGDWHFYTLTTRLDGRPGILIYVDGTLVAQTPLPGYQRSNATYETDGGGPMDLAGEIVLCSRDNVTSERHYTGSLAHLALFDVVLTTQQIDALHAAVPQEEKKAAPQTSPLGDTVWLDQFNGDTFLQVEAGTVVTCLTNQTTTCGPDYQCVPLTPSQINSLGSQFSGVPVGVCAQSNGVKFPSDSLPTPAAFFPLSNYTASAWPVPDKWLWNSTDAGVEWVEDPVFGNVISCNASTGSSLSLGKFDWGSSGGFAFNIWLQQRENTGDYFQYLISTRADSNGPISNASLDVYRPNEVHVYLPESRHPAHDLVRAIVKDGNDNYTSVVDENFLDSDGFIGSNDVRDTARLNLTDSAWHMVTVSTLASGEKGFAIFVDGLLSSTMEDPPNFYSISGGDPIAINGDLVLCGRSDLASDRFFDGKVSQFSIFGNALTSQAVSTLYRQVYSSAPKQSKVASMAHTLNKSTAPAEASAPRLFTSSQIGATGIGLERVPGLAEGSIEESNTPVRGRSQERSQPDTDEAAAGARSTTTSSESKSSSVSDSNGGGSSKLSGGAIAGIVVGVLAGLILLSALVAMLVLSARRRRMTGVARLQEIPMPDLGPGANVPYQEDQFVVTLNQKILEAEQRKRTEVKDARGIGAGIDPGH